MSKWGSLDRRLFSLGLAATLTACAGTSEQMKAAATTDDGRPGPTADAPRIAGTGRRLALVIGNQHYRSVTPLRNAQADSNLVAAAFRRAGFELIEDRVFGDLGRPELELAFRVLAREAARADGLVVYYAGHGIQVSGRNYLVPIDLRALRFGTLEADMFPVASALRFVADAGARYGMALFDACRENPFVAERVGGIERGLAQVVPGPRLAVGFSSQPGSAALDGAGVDGPYAEALARNVGSAGTLESLLSRTSLAVWKATGGVERPWSAIGKDLRGVSIIKAGASA